MEPMRKSVSGFQTGADPDDPYGTEGGPSGIGDPSPRGPRSGQGRVETGRPSEGGFSFAGFTLVLLIFTMGAGILHLFAVMHGKVKEQIELDHFTGGIALQLRASVLTIEESEARLDRAKAIVAAGCAAVPPACPSLHDTYETLKKIEFLIQRLARVKWEAQHVEWITKNPLFGTRTAFPDLDESIHSGNLELGFEQNGLTSRARVWTNKKGIKPHEWKAAWTD